MRRTRRCAIWCVPARLRFGWQARRVNTFRVLCCATDGSIQERRAGPGTPVQACDSVLHASSATDRSEILRPPPLCTKSEATENRCETSKVERHGEMSEILPRAECGSILRECTVGWEANCGTGAAARRRRNRQFCTMQLRKLLNYRKTNSGALKLTVVSRTYLLKHRHDFFQFTGFNPNPGIGDRQCDAVCQIRSSETCASVGTSVYTAGPAGL